MVDMGIDSGAVLRLIAARWCVVTATDAAPTLQPQAVPAPHRHVHGQRGGVKQSMRPIVGPSHAGPEPLLTYRATGRPGYHDDRTTANLPYEYIAVPTSEMSEFTLPPSKKSRRHFIYEPRLVQTRKLDIIYVNKEL